MEVRRLDQDYAQGIQGFARRESVFVFGLCFDCLMCVEEAAEHGTKAAHIQQSVAQRQDHCSVLVPWCCVGLLKGVCHAFF